MREISPAINLSVEEYLMRAPPRSRQLAARIRQQKANGSRPRPSATLIDRSTLLEPTTRANLLDSIAVLVDENLFGRSDMCMQFADLLQRALAYYELPARAVLGKATYFVGRREVFRWNHAWVRVGGEVIDGNVDILAENPAVPSEVRLAPYWGPITDTPSDRQLRQQKGSPLPPDSDVANIWWPELQARLDSGHIGSHSP